jgi:tetratricopeptide (TPR) repeat protein
MNNSLDAYGILNGTDKSSLNHDFLRHYERILAPFRYEPITLLEIGIFHGASLRMWSDYLEKALIVGVDIQPECAEHAGDRREVEIGSQADKDFLDDIGRRRQPNVIIDDGSHQADHVIFTFRHLFPHLRPGGIYIVEDMHFHAGPGAAHWRGSSDNLSPPQDVFLRLARLVSCPQTEGDDERDFAQRTDSVEFFYGGVAIRKRPARHPADVAIRRSLVERANRPKTWSAFALHTFNNTGDLAESVECARRAIDLEPRNPEHQDILSVILEHASDFAGALAAAEDASRLNPADNRLKARVTALRSRI